MRTTITIPDSYYAKIKAKYTQEGYLTVNDFILDLIRHKMVDNQIGTPLAKNISTFPEGSSHHGELLDVVTKEE